MIILIKLFNLILFVRCDYLNYTELLNKKWAYRFLEFKKMLKLHFFLCGQRWGMGWIWGWTYLAEFVHIYLPSCKQLNWHT